METLKKRSEFLIVAKGGRVARRAFLLQAAKTRSGSGARIGYTVTKKIGNAVVRNRIKRRLRAAVAQINPECTKDGADYVLIGRRAALTQPFDALVSDLSGCIKAAFKPNRRRTPKSKDRVSQESRNGNSAPPSSFNSSNMSDTVDER